MAARRQSRADKDASAARRARQISRGIRAGGYAGAVPSRHRTDMAYRRAIPGDESSVLGAYDRQRLALESRDLFRNSSIVQGAIQCIQQNVVGPLGLGIAPQAKTADKSWNELAEARWGEWSKVADCRGRVSLREMLKLTISEVVLSGDIGFVLLDGGQIQPIESDRIVTPDPAPKGKRIVEGVELDGMDRFIAFHLAPRDKYGRPDAKRTVRVDAKDFVFVSRPERPDQVRGVPLLHACVNSLRDLDETTVAMLLKVKSEAKKFYALKTQSADAANLGARDATSDNADGTDQRFSRESLGEVFHLLTDEQLELISGQSPGATYDGFITSILRMIGVALGLPLELLMLDFSGGSYVKARAALIQSHRGFDSWAGLIVEQLLTRLWNWRTAKWIKDETLPPAPVDDMGVSQWWRVGWVLPERPILDEQKTAAANAQELTIGSTSLTRIARKRGVGEATDILSEKAQEIRWAIAEATAINKEAGAVVVSWRDLIGTPIGAASAPAPSAAADMPKEEIDEGDMDDETA